MACVGLWVRNIHRCEPHSIYWGYRIEFYGDYPAKTNGAKLEKIKTQEMLYGKLTPKERKAWLNE